MVSIWGFVPTDGGITVRHGQLLENNQGEQVRKSKAAAAANTFFKK